MTYLLVKSFHLASVMIWISGMLAVPVFIWLLNDLPSVDRIRLTGVVRRVFRSGVSSAMALSWILGLWLVSTGGWFQSGWMMAKLLLVVLFSALHGFFAGQLRRLESDPEYRVGDRAWVITIIEIGLLITIVLLVINKPF